MVCLSNFSKRKNVQNQTFHGETALSILAQYNQPRQIDEILDGETNKFFIEAGAYDGEIYSNTLLFEVERNWTGLLVEPNPVLFQRMQQKGR